VLPEELARTELAQWITGMNWPTQAPQSGSEPSPDELIIFVVLEEALTFYLASLFHLGRIVKASDSRIELISRLEKTPNFKASTARLGPRLGLSQAESGKLLKESCVKEMNFQTERKERALRGWELWQHGAAPLKRLLTSQQRLLTTNDGVGVVFLVCSNGTEELLDTMREYGDSCLAGSSSMLSRALDWIASSHVGVYKTFADATYWSQVVATCSRLSLLPKIKRTNTLRGSFIADDKVLNKPPKDEIIRDEKAEKLHPYKNLIAPGLAEERELLFAMKRRTTWQERLRIERRIHKLTTNAQGMDPGLVPLARAFLEKLTKLFIVGGRRPPVWQRVREVAKWNWVANALREADVSAEYLINDFGDELVFFSKQGEAPLPRIPLSDKQWRTWTTLFFRNWWVPSLRSKGAGRLAELNERKFDAVAKAAAFLLDAMGYTFADDKGRPSSGGGGGLTESGYVPSSNTIRGQD
jgi:hypothetical protein